MTTGNIVSEEGPRPGLCDTHVDAFLAYLRDPSAECLEFRQPQTPPISTTFAKSVG